MTPFASVAMLEKLALLKIALCRAPALSSVSSACLRAVLSVFWETPVRVLVSTFPLVMVLSRWLVPVSTAGLHNYAAEQLVNGVLEFLFGVRLLEEVCTF